jgi:hypothetical protein
MAFSSILNEYARLVEENARLEAEIEAFKEKQRKEAAEAGAQIAP